MYTAIFFTVKHHFFGKDELVKNVIKTGKSDVFEAFEVALDHGCDPNKKVYMKWEDEK